MIICCFLLTRYKCHQGTSLFTRTLTSTCISRSCDIKRT
uniref:Uncharacterized protein n=1 Tax=Rhizophora mucronata TaxID=61149 RepID=A0A2P2MGW6_RHIMU